MGCLSPIDVRRPNWALVRRYIAVPCGRCVGCRIERARNWTIRIMNEAQMHRENCFVTLTYRDEKLTYSNCNATLVKSDLQKFWKRLRKELDHEIRYFACGEYGELYSRPHYHACVFGHDFEDKTLFSTENGNNLYRSDLLDSVWGNGYCTIGALTPSSAAYVARYILDKGLGDERIRYQELGITPEFVVMSRGGKDKKGGIGRKWIEQYASDVYPQDAIVSIDGQKSKPPRYYDEYQKTQNPEQVQRIKNARLEKAEKREYAEKSATRMLSKIRFHESRVKNSVKKLHR